VDILEFSNLICKKLVIRSRRQHERLAAFTELNKDNASILEQITTLVPWEKLNMCKQHSGAVTEKCPFAKKIKAT
jgi:hypothetical protein